MADRLPLDATLTLAFALHHTKGGYALLLGSGASRTAGIPTGWEVIQDLARQVAALEGADAGPDPSAWYTARFGEAPDYARLLEAVAGSPTERRALLRGYFEPTPDERAEGRKSPTAAHRAIGQLVAGGYVRVIVTTNFDQLVETALRDAGVPPVVVSGPGDVAGMMPLHLAPVTVIKLHGDYLDTRVKNTPAELAAYDPAIDALLDRVLDEYGLVVCGWSAAWDDALRAAIRRCPSRRFTTYWATTGGLGPEARDLIEWRRAEVVPVTGADPFFTAVAEKVAALEELARPHPTSTAAAVTALKRYLLAPESRIRLHDLVMDEVEAVRARAVDLPMDAPSNEAIAAAATRAEAASETLVALLAAGAYFGESAHRPLWVRAIERLGGGRSEHPGVRYTTWDELAKYPAQLAFYAAGLGAVAGGDEETLADVLLLPRIAAPNEASAVPAIALHVNALSRGGEWAKALPDLDRHKTPMSDRLHGVLRPAFRALVPDDLAYDLAFDRFEYLVALAWAGVTFAGKPTEGAAYGPVGRFGWRGFDADAGGLSAAVGAEIERAGRSWFLLRRGLFDGTPERLLSVKMEVDKGAQRSRFW